TRERSEAQAQRAKGRAESRRCSYIPSGFRFAQLAQSARPSPEGSVVGKPTSAQARKRTLLFLRFAPIGRSQSTGALARKKRKVLFDERFALIRSLRDRA